MCGGSVLFDEPQARRGGDGQGEADGLRLARHARVAHDGGHDLVALVAVDDDVDHFLFSGKGNAEELFRALHAGALGVDDRAARRAREVWFLADDTKFGSIYPAVIAGLQDGSILTNRCPDTRYRQQTLAKEAEV